MCIIFRTREGTHRYLTRFSNSQRLFWVKMFGSSKTRNQIQLKYLLFLSQTWNLSYIFHPLDSKIFYLGLKKSHKTQPFGQKVKMINHFNMHVHMLRSRNITRNEKSFALMPANFFIADSAQTGYCTTFQC